MQSPGPHTIVNISSHFALVDRQALSLPFFRLFPGSKKSHTSAAVPVNHVFHNPLARFRPRLFSPQRCACLKGLRNLRGRILAD